MSRFSRVAYGRLLEGSLQLSSPGMHFPPQPSYHLWCHFDILPSIPGLASQPFCVS